MTRKKDNARELLMSHGKDFMLNNLDGSKGKFNVRTITEECGMATGTFYNYFDSKDDLARQIVADDWKKVMDNSDELIEMDIPLRDKLEAIYNRIDNFEKNYKYSAIGLLGPSPENVAFRKGKLEELDAKLQIFIKNEVDRGTLEIDADIESAAYLLMHLFFTTSENEKMSFDQMWKCMTFRSISD